MKAFKIKAFKMRAIVPQTIVLHGLPAKLREALQISCQGPVLNTRVHRFAMNVCLKARDPQAKSLDADTVREQFFKLPGA